MGASYPMSKNQKAVNRDEVPLEKIVLSNMYSMEALIDLLAEKGFSTGNSYE